jgi:acyl-CoA thioesterase
MGLVLNKTRRPFSWTHDEKYKQSLQSASDDDGLQRGVFFDASGNARAEVVNPQAQYNYIWKTKLKGEKHEDKL